MPGILREQVADLPESESLLLEVLDLPDAFEASGIIKRVVGGGFVGDHQ